MSQDYHHHHQHQGNIFTFPNGFQQQNQEEQDHNNHITQQQIRRDKMRLQGFEPPPPPLVAVEEGESSGLPVGYETAGMLSEMFNFTSVNNNLPPPHTATPSGGDMTSLDNQFSQSYHHHHQHQRSIPPPNTNDWYNLGPLDETKDHHHQQMNAESAVAMQLFLMNPQSTAARSPSPSPSAASSSSTLHMLLPNQGFHHSSTGGHFGPTNQFTTWGGDHQNNNTHNQGLSLSLSNSLQHLEAAAGKAEELLFFNQQGAASHGGTTISNNNPYKNFGPLQMGQNPNQQVHVGFGSSSLGVVNVLRSSKYAKAAQELLEEFCSVGRGQFKKKQEINTNNPNQNPSGGGGGGGNSPSSSKDVVHPLPPPPAPALSATDRLEHQRRKVKLLTMLDEVDKRYNHYCEQMQMVVNSFDLVMGFGAAIPYTALAQKAMSRHFRCLKDAIAAQLKQSCEVLGEKDAGTSGVTKGETPRLRLLEQSLRQQRAFHQMGMMEQEAWRPQRGLPERSVNILRAWLFEHFLHPYPSDADKHLLARQTGLSRNQVSNWFINARVRLWKPMVEEMYQQESKDIEQGHTTDINPTSNAQTPIQNNTTTTTIPSPTATPTPTSATTVKRTEFNDSENDPSLVAINRQHLNNSSSSFAAGGALMSISPPSFSPTSIQESDFRAGAEMSLTLGLRHAGNLPDKSNFVRDFGGF